MHRVFSPRLVFFLGLSLAFFLPGCGDKPPRYPQDHARFERIVEAVEALRLSYEEQDTAALQELMLPLEVLLRLQAEIQKDFLTYSEISLSMTIERMAIKGGRATVNFRWEGVWQETLQGSILNGRGHGILVWSGRQVILLADVEGDLPFGMASRQAIS